MSKIYIYHHNDHDGIVSAGILYNSLRSLNNRKEIIFHMIDYDVLLNFDEINFIDGDTVYFLDYSFSNMHNIAQLENLLRKRSNSNDVIWIDHHATSIGKLEEYGIPGIRKIGLCGAAWTYLFCKDKLDEYKDLSKEDASDKFHNEAPLFLRFIDDYDCWKKLYSQTNDFHYGLIVSDPRDLIIERLMVEDDTDILPVFMDVINTGQKIQAYLNFNDREYHVNMYGFEYTLPEEHGGYKCFCLNRKGNSLMFGDKINEYDAVIPFFFVNGKWKYSIFTNKENVDCKGVAESYGGGGHAKAAGWITDKLIFEE